MIPVSYLLTVRLCGKWNRMTVMIPVSYLLTLWLCGKWNRMPVSLLSSYSTPRKDKGNLTSNLLKYKLQYNYIYIFDMNIRKCTATYLSDKYERTIARYIMWSWIKITFQAHKDLFVPIDILPYIFIMLFEMHIIIILLVYF